MGRRSKHQRARGTDRKQRSSTVAVGRSLHERRKVWLDAVSGSDRNSIVQQLTWMSWDIASFRIINIARGLAPKDPDGHPKVNGLLHGLLDSGFFERQLLAIRRLTDGQGLHGDMGVLSLLAVLDDMLAHRLLLTRARIIEAEEATITNLPLKAGFIQLTNERLDRIVGVSTAKRSPSDVIPAVFLENLRNKVVRARGNAKVYVDKFVAHAATPWSRVTKGADDIEITLGQLWASHRALCEVAGFLQIEVLGDSATGFLPLPQYDQFEHLDLPLADARGIRRFELEWRRAESEFKGFSQWSLDEYFSEFPAGPPRTEPVASESCELQHGPGPDHASGTTADEPL
jgi:hypothetical protein